MKAIRAVITTSLGVAAIVAIVHAHHPGTGAPSPGELNAGYARYTVTIDESGKFVEGPALVVPIKETDRIGFSSSSEGLVLKDSPVPGGGQMIDLQGRFRHSMAASVGNGDLETDCVTEPGEDGVDGR